MCAELSHKSLQLGIRSVPGSGAHLGRMTLDPAVTAFCLAASRPFETAGDANIKDRGQGTAANRTGYQQDVTKGRYNLDNADV